MLFLFPRSVQCRRTLGTAWGRALGADMVGSRGVIIGGGRAINAGTRAAPPKALVTPGARMSSSESSSAAADPSGSVTSGRVARARSPRRAFTTLFGGAKTSFAFTKPHAPCSGFFDESMLLSSSQCTVVPR